jgi:hypothetical protein
VSYELVQTLAANNIFLQKQDILDKTFGAGKDYMHDALPGLHVSQERGYIKYKEVL